MKHFCKTFCLTGLVLLYCATMAQAQRGGYRKMVCRGSEEAFRIDDLNKKGINIELGVNFSPSAHVPGNDVWNLDAGTCSWVDRLVSETEPQQIQLTVTSEVAQRIRQRLNTPDNFWQFFVQDTKRGYYETRNHAQLVVQPKGQGSKKISLPDLAVEGARVEDSDKTKFTVSIKNQGNAAAGASFVVVSFFRTGSPDKGNIFRARVPAIPAGKTVDVVISTKLELNLYYYCITVDGTNLIKESNKGNNRVCS
jgi:hypothetical protein